MRFVHSRCKLGLFLCGYALDSRCDLRGILELGAFVLPWSIFVHVLLNILHQVTEAFAFVVPCALVMHLTERPLNRVGTWAVCREPKQRKAGVTGQPLGHGFGCMTTVVIHDDIDARHCRGWLCGIQQR